MLHRIPASFCPDSTQTGSIKRIITDFFANWGSNNPCISSFAIVEELAGPPFPDPGGDLLFTEINTI
ncbi:MAG: hypothetical protein ABJB86_22815 [Bacteroidota bacterium]